MQQLKVIEFKGQRVLTTQQLAQCYETTRHIISNNFTRNKNRYVVGKHYIPLEGTMLQDFKRCHQFDDSMKNVSVLYLWTEKGALLHAKSLNTDKAWEVYDYLVDFYFRVKEKQEPEETEVVPVTTKTEPLKDELFAETDNRDEISIFKILLQAAENRGLIVKTKPLITVKSCLRGDRIAIRPGMTLSQVNYELAFELFHSAVNYDRGNMIDTPLRSYYNKQAERAAEFIIQLMTLKTA